MTRRHLKPRCLLVLWGLAAVGANFGKPGYGSEKGRQEIEAFLDKQKNIYIISVCHK